ncbi:DUF397 domain-containing protein [Sphaerisporangium sp. NPDC051011]|uniref:DUF397 domain-containing protein n=1 Tax=Sphaerisporangium sp. NPDC051011 TaxID=3155792 RepID=UPI0033DB1B8E
MRSDLIGLIEEVVIRMAPDLRGAHWCTSSYSSDSGQCVEVASNIPGLIAVRDSKIPTAPPLTFSPVEWSAFLRGIRQAEI